MTHRKRRRLDPPASSTPETTSIRSVVDVVVKADAVGTLEAVVQAVSAVEVGGVRLQGVASGVGDVTRSDVLMASTAGHLILGFQVTVLPGVEAYAREQEVEVRLYRVISQLTRDIEGIAASLVPRQPKERILGKGKVIALFKSTRKSIILGCEVTQGSIARGHQFRVVDLAGEIYRGTVRSLHIGPEAVGRAQRGQQVGLKIEDFQKARIGDRVETYEPEPIGGPVPWCPRGGVYPVSS